MWFDDPELHLSRSRSVSQSSRAQDGSRPSPSLSVSLSTQPISLPGLAAAWSIADATTTDQPRAGGCRSGRRARQIKKNISINLRPKPREWLRSWIPSQPLPFERMPLHPFTRALGCRVVVRKRVLAIRSKWVTWRPLSTQVRCYRPVLESLDRDMFRRRSIS